MIFQWEMDQMRDIDKERYIAKQREMWKERQIERNRKRFVCPNVQSDVNLVF